MALRRSRRKNLALYIGVLMLLLIGYLTKELPELISGKEDSDADRTNVGSRRLLSVNSRVSASSSKNGTQCTQPSINQFPKDIFTQKQRKYGAVLLHIFMAIYMFVALAFVCDDYFISSLDKICERLDLSEDVAGATFMAAGSSAPELFASVIGVFIAKGDVGVGTIVGSAVFNILIIISLCALFAGQVVHLTWWPLLRDSSCYMVAVGTLIWVLYDGHVAWYESLVMVLLYVCYIVVMKVNPHIVKYLKKREARKEAISHMNHSDKSKLLNGTDVVVNYTETYVGNYVDEQTTSNNSCRRLTFKELGLMVMLTDKFSPVTRFRAACLIIIYRGDHKKSHQNGYKKIENAHDSFRNGDIGNGHVKSDKNESFKLEDSDSEGTPFLYPQGTLIRTIFWGISLPLVTLLYFTVPDCRKPKWAAWYLLTFLMSVIWIGIFSYVLVWMVCIIGFTLGIPDVIMGITFLAAGTSIPDAVSSLLVAREGLGDMAVSNSIGSNVFDILIGLAVPWLIKSGLESPGTTVFGVISTTGSIVTRVGWITLPLWEAMTEPIFVKDFGHFAMFQKMIKINSRGMIYSVCLLFGSVLLTIFSINCNKWQLDRKLGIIFLVLYVVFITMSACIEFNLFGFVNFPTCKL